MEFFGYTMCGPQNYWKDIVRENYREPTCDNDVKNVLRKISKQSGSNANELNNGYVGELNGFAYGSFQRLAKMKRKGVIKPINPFDIYRYPPTSSTEFGWWQRDTALTDATWYQAFPRYPQPVSPNTLILDKVRKNNKYATLF
ncbi:unnamed protein product [Parnassius mnemosyne]|uniref:Uncharacterized protein n=1 Tax=Parnassius mnemosyne TaxID=213953 RepID=A0AAV1M2W4_9NEOP